MGPRHHAQTQSRCLDCGKFQRYPEQFYEDECCGKCWLLREESRRRQEDARRRYGF